MPEDDLRAHITADVGSAFGEHKHIDNEQYRALLAGLEGTYFPKYAVKLAARGGGRPTPRSWRSASCQAAMETYARKEQEVTSPIMRELERVIMLRVVDEFWMDHIDAMQELRQGIRLRAYAQTDPIIAYKQESLHMFEEMIDAIQEETVRRIYSFRLKTQEEVKRERVATGITEGWRRRQDREEAAPPGPEDRPQRSLPLRKRKEVQTLLREINFLPRLWEAAGRGGLLSFYISPVPAHGTNGLRFGHRRAGGGEIFSFAGLLLFCLIAPRGFPPPYPGLLFAA